MYLLNYSNVRFSVIKYLNRNNPDNMVEKNEMTKCVNKANHIHLAELQTFCGKFKHFILCNTDQIRPFRFVKSMNEYISGTFQIL